MHFFFLRRLPFFAFLHLLADATGPVFALTGRASIPPATAAVSRRRAIRLASNDTPVDSAAARAGQARKPGLDRNLVLTIRVKKLRREAEEKAVTPEQTEHRAKQAEHLLERYRELEREREGAGLYGSGLGLRNACARVWTR